MKEEFTRTEMLLGRDAVKTLEKARVAVFGLGGVGGYTVEALSRAGVGNLVLVDKDTVSLSNLNRQLLATHATVGMLKTEAARLRILEHFHHVVSVALYRYLVYAFKGLSLSSLHWSRKRQFHLKLTASSSHGSKVCYLCRNLHRAAFGHSQGVYIQQI